MPPLPPPSRSTPTAEISPADLLTGQLSAAQLERRQQRQQILVALLEALEGDVLNEYSPSAVLGFSEAIDVDLDLLLPVISLAVDAGWLVRTSALLDDGLSGIRFTARGILAVEAMALNADPSAFV